YATWNLTGGVAASSPILDGTPNNTNVPSGNIGSCQGFFVRTSTNGSKTFNFQNTQRGLLPTYQNTQFYKSNVNNVHQKNRIWLFLTNNSSITRYNLIGYVANASDDFDNQYDAQSLGAINQIYSILDETHLTIQGKALPFNVEDKIKLGLKLTVSGD